MPNISPIGGILLKATLNDYRQITNIWLHWRLCLAFLLIQKVFENRDEKCQQFFIEFIPCFQIHDFKVHLQFPWPASKLYLLPERKSIDWCDLHWDSWLNLVSIVGYNFDPGEDKCLANWKSEAVIQNAWYQSWAVDSRSNFELL